MARNAEEGEPGFPGARLHLPMAMQHRGAAAPGGAAQPAFAAAFWARMSDFWMQRSFTLALQ
jgi:hypothetical protein